MKNIIVYGSINTDLFISTSRIPHSGETIKGSHFFTSQGGKGANQAVAAARLGGKVVLLGCVGNDLFGSNSIKSLKENGVNVDHIHVVEGIATGVAMIIKCENDNRIILESGANGHLKAKNFEAYLVNQCEPSLFVCQLETDINETIQALKLAKTHGLLTIFNPAPAIKLDKEVYTYTDLLVINQSEAEILSGIYPNDIIDCQAVYQHVGVKNVIVTLGKKGSVVLEENHVQLIEGLKVDVVDTTGAGDAYIGALAYGLSKQFTLIDSAKLANVVSALKVTKLGAQNMPTMNEVINVGVTHE